MGVIFPSAGGRLPHRLGPFPFIMGVILPSAGGHVALCWEGGGVADLVGGWGEGGAGGGGGIADLVGGGSGGGVGGNGVGGGGGVVWCVPVFALLGAKPWVPRSDHTSHIMYHKSTSHIRLPPARHEASGHRNGPPQCERAWEEEARSMAAPPRWYSEGWGGPAPDLWTLVH